MRGNAGYAAKKQSARGLPPGRAAGCVISWQQLSPVRYGIRNTNPVTTPASANPARTLNGIGSSMYGAQLPGR